MSNTTLHSTRDFSSIREFVSEQVHEIFNVNAEAISRGLFAELPHESPYYFCNMLAYQLNDKIGAVIAQQLPCDRARVLLRELIKDYVANYLQTMTMPSNTAS